MFESLKPLPDDPILHLASLFREDSRPHKIDVGVGIYQDSQGKTPVMRAVKAAEYELWQHQESKKYLGLAGNEAFTDALSALVLGEKLPDRMRAVQTIAGTGALSLIAETLSSMMPDATVYIPDPSWGNHYAIFKRAGLRTASYPYYSAQSTSLEREAMFDFFNQLDANAIVLLHGCCHNPSGEDLSHDDWQKLVHIAQSRGFLPIIDLAYLGFGKGLAEDAYGVRLMAESLEQMFIAVSCSKNFGLYRDRAGMAVAVGKSPTIAHAMQSHLCGVSRSLVSVPADHGAAVVANILTNVERRATWMAELTEMADNIATKRRQFAEALQTATQTDWQFITHQQGMFSLLPLGQEMVIRLREEYAIYMVGNGRVNIAGLRNQDACMAVAKAVAAVQRK